MSAAYEIQKVVYAKLTGDATLSGMVAGVYDEAPGLPIGLPDNGFPYVTLGEDDLTPFDTDDQVGHTVSIVVHIWSRYKGMKEVKQISGRIYELLHRAQLTVTGYNFVDCLLNTSTFLTEDDSNHRHGRDRYRITIQEA